MRSSATSAPRLAREVLLSPGAALEALSAPNASFSAPLALYAAYLAASALVDLLKPAGFPPPPPGTPAGPESPLWALLMADPLLAVLLFAFCGYFARILREGRLPLRLAAAVLLPVLPACVLILASGTLLSKAVAAAGLLAVTAAMAPGFAKVEPSLWRPLGAWVLAVNACGLALAPFFAASALLRLPRLYFALQLLMLLWTVALAAFGLSRLARMSRPRAVCAVALALVCQTLALGALYRLGLLPRALLDALMGA